ncbi:signal peptidase II [Vagococcus humatus]|uniref:Lipoprotein signal peptidase n=1 Tax=Vagococcus humatus TaxID=1889241 RepID=A0A429Z8H9_9ENTE|nr:signal peptidase II [Vagococcus humatus]RST89994.1 signal peptidase II [Vagococcus humatus]
MIIFLLIAVGLVALDQWVKYWIVTHLALGETLFSDNSFLALTHIRNEGAAWSILEGKMWFFTIVTIVVIIGILYYLYQMKHQYNFFTIGLTLMLAGAVGNFIDRLRQGYVVDMFELQFIRFPIFNVADIALTIGVVCVFIYLIMEESH